MRHVLWLVPLALTHLPATAHADPQQCITLHADGQVLRKSGRFLIAKEKFLACSSDACPELVKRDCTVFATELEAALPSVQVEARDAANRPLPGALMSIDDAAQMALPSTPLSLDPGQHRIVVSVPGGRSRSASFDLHEGEKNRSVLVTFEALGAAAAKQGSGWPGVPTASYVLGGTALVALGSFTYFGLRGRAKEQDFEVCRSTHTCPPADVREMRHSYLAADVSLGISLVSLGLGAYFLVKHAQEPARPSGALRLRWTVSTVPSKCLLTASGSF